MVGWGRWWGGEGGGVWGRGWGRWWGGEGGGVGGGVGRWGGVGLGWVVWGWVGPTFLGPVRDKGSHSASSVVQCPRKKKEPFLGRPLLVGQPPKNKGKRAPPLQPSFMMLVYHQMHLVSPGLSKISVRDTAGSCPRPYHFKESPRFPQPVLFPQSWFPIGSLVLSQRFGTAPFEVFPSENCGFWRS